ncbi:MAG: tetratricopeptide repeat protein [Gemmatimonadota bacterium]
MGETVGLRGVSRASVKRLLRRLASFSPILLIACGASPGDAVERGDRLYGAGRVEEAIAEYKLALRQQGEEPSLLLRIGSAYAGQGEVDASLDYFGRLLEADSAYRYQVAAELAEAARVALRSGARDNMARALEPVQAIGIGMIPEDLRLELARYYSDQDDHARALPLYLSLADGEDSPVPTIAMYETARAFRALGGCREALEYYERVVEAGPDLDPASRTSARWQYGDCLYAVAGEERTAGRTEAAKRRLDRLIELGVPQTLLDRAHYRRGELLLESGDEEEARADFQAVLDLNPARSGQLVQQAEDRIREIRYRSP